MLKITLLVFCLFYVSIIAEYCNEDKCKLPSCACSGSIPKVDGKIPQFIVLSSDDAPSDLIFNKFYKSELFSRKNPDNCPISGTFFVPHEYTNYTIVNQLYNRGFEIGSHSITKNYTTEYWTNATEQDVIDEMGGQRCIISKYANIPINDIIGARIPFFQINGDLTYTALQKSKFVYDNSWTSFSYNPLYPYTLDYESSQQCLIGKCPVQPHKDFWLVPVRNWNNTLNVQCNKLLACGVEGNADEVFQWMKNYFDIIYKNDERFPMSLVINDAWFDVSKSGFDALHKFFDYIATLKDVFVISNKQLLEWVKNPVPVDKYNSCKTKPKPSSCKPINCPLQTDNGDFRYMASCIACPSKYPWLKNTKCE